MNGNGYGLRCPQWGLVVRLRYPYRLPVAFNVTLADTGFVTLTVAESLDGLRHRSRYRNTGQIRGPKLCKGLSIFEDRRVRR